MVREKDKFPLTEGLFLWIMWLLKYFTFKVWLQLKTNLIQSISGLREHIFFFSYWFHRVQRDRLQEIKHTALKVGFFFFPVSSEYLLRAEISLSGIWSCRCLRNNILKTMFTYKWLKQVDIAGCYCHETTNMNMLKGIIWQDKEIFPWTHNNVGLLS